MRPYNGAELISIFILPLPSKLTNKNNFVLYSDDSLAILNNTSGLLGSEIEKLKGKNSKNYLKKQA